MALHQFARARDDGLNLVDLAADKRYPLEILGDAQLELGDTDAAAETYKKLVAFNDGDTDAATEYRLSRLDWAKGDLAAARKHLEAAVELAEAQLAESPEIVAWVRVQYGQFAFMTGDWKTADEQYQAALAVKPNDWPALDHKAELLAARGKFDEAAAVYQPLVKRVPRPELQQALGDVYAAAGKPADAKPWHDLAEAGYLKACAEGNAHYYHHLAGFYSDSRPDPTRAVEWAKMDLEIRHTAAAHDALAWALYQDGQFPAATEEMGKALAGGTNDSHVLYHASLVYLKAGDPARARECLKRAAAANPKLNTFHVHR